ncbi:MAG: hypothetical protein M3O71_12590 [Bacteroidota bacterium]|nr:hypothetical protein [Bacteroidota bacterium]
MKKRYLLLLSVVLIGLVINSCKKTGQNAIPALFSGGTWQLASIETATYTGNTQLTDTTVNDTCGQYFTFKPDFTCTYTNFNCLTQSSSGTWALTPNQLYLNADMTCDSTTTTKTKPFINAQIITLGVYSMVLNTGDIAPNYSLTKPRKIVKYGFIRQKTTTGN